METQKFERKPFYVEAVRVTAQNLEEVAAWCKGEVLEEDGKRYISVKVHMPLNDRQTQAFVGDWVLFANKGHKVYQNKSFWASFVRVEQASADALAQLAAAKNGDKNAAPTNVNPALLKQKHDAAARNQEKQHKIHRSAKTGKIVTAEEAAENPDTTVTETVTTPAAFDGDSSVLDTQPTPASLPQDASLGERAEL